MVGANRHYISDAKQIEKDAPEILDHVKQGKLSIPQAKQVAALPVTQRPAAIERVCRNDNAEEVIDTLAEEVETLQFTQRFGTPFDPTGAKTGSEILSLCAKVKTLEDEVERLRPWHVTCSPRKVSHPIPPLSLLPCTRRWVRYLHPRCSSKSSNMLPRGS